MNCSLFSKEVLESEMFGHKIGFFTVALKDKKGLFEKANNGSIFLDEIGEMAFELQAKILYMFETGEHIKKSTRRLVYNRDIIYSFCCEHIKKSTRRIQVNASVISERCSVLFQLLSPL